MINLQKYCDYLYNSLYIPVYLYDNKKLAACYPTQEENTYPPPPYLASLWGTDKKVSYTMTKFYSYYGCIKMENSSYCIVMGPINDFPYSNESLLVMSREFSVANSKAEAFSEFFRNIPQQNLDTFINILLLVNFIVNNTELSRQDVEASASSLSDISINQKYSEEVYAAKEEGIFNNSYAIEIEMLRYIETGNIEGLDKFHTLSRNAKVGKMANNNLRQLRNMFIAEVTLTTRAAIRGGLTPSIAYKLSDIYIQQVERLTDVDAIKSLSGQVLLDYTNRVANSKIPATADIMLHQVIQYIRENTNKNITVANAADHIGFTRPSLSRKFKKELGIDLSTFIRKCKLEEAKDLLAFSDKSISEISSYLCFSSQSHFQKSFKKYFDITPQAFRKSV